MSGTGETASAEPADEGRGEPVAASSGQAADRALPSPGWRWLELFAMFVAAPSLLAAFMRGWMVFPAIWLLGAVALVMLRRDPTFDRAEIGGLGVMRRAGMGIVVRAGLAAAAMLGLLAIYRSEWLFALVRERTALWAIIMVGYPVLSVYPQELAFRTFFRQRYRGLFPSDAAYLVVNAAAFGYAHIIMHNAIAIGLSFVGGVVLAWAYEQHRRTMAAWLEHALYGCAAFTIGWGPLLYGGRIG